MYLPCKSVLLENDTIFLINQKAHIDYLYTAAHVYLQYKSDVTKVVGVSNINKYQGNGNKTFRHTFYEWKKGNLTYLLESHEIPHSSSPPLINEYLSK